MQLISYVLISMKNYWSSIFILPQKVLKAIEGVPRAFFFGPGES